MKEVKVDEDSSVEIGDEVGFGSEEIVVGDGGDLRFGDNPDNLGPRQPRILVLRHCFSKHPIIQCNKPPKNHQNIITKLPKGITY